MSAEHDRHFFDTFMIVLGALVAFTFFIYFLANAIHARTQGAYIEENPLKAELIGQRLAPVATVAVAGQAMPKTAVATPAPQPPAAPATDAGMDGKKVYESACVACHALAVAGAPKFGDADAWAPRIAKGIDALYANSINGFQGEAGVMPPKGGRLDLSDDHIKAGVDYMVEAASN